MSKRSHKDDEAAGVADATCDALVVDDSAVARANAAIPDDRGMKALADIFDALADPTRLRILVALSAGNLCVCDLSAITGVSSSAVSHQLRLLRDRNLVAFERDGKRAIYRLADSHVATLLAQGLDHARER